MDIKIRRFTDTVRVSGVYDVAMKANDMITAVVLAELRRRGMTRADLARILDVPPAYITHKLNHHRRWSVEDLDLLSTRLGIPLSWFLMPTPADTMAHTSGDPVRYPPKRAVNLSRRPAGFYPKLGGTSRKIYGDRTPAFGCLRAA